MLASAPSDLHPASAIVAATASPPPGRTPRRLRRPDLLPGRPARSCTLLPAAASTAVFVGWPAAAFPVLVVVVAAGRVCYLGSLLRNLKLHRPLRLHCYHSHPHQSSRSVKHSTNTTSCDPARQVPPVSAGRFGPSAAGHPVPRAVLLLTRRPPRPGLRRRPPSDPPLGFLLLDSRSLSFEVFCGN